MLRIEVEAEGQNTIQTISGLQEEVRTETDMEKQKTTINRHKRRKIYILVILSKEVRLIP